MIGGQGRLAYPVPVELDPATDYPLGTRRPDLVTTPSGIALDRVTLDAARAGELSGADVRATAATLSLQADVARTAGRPQLADGLERAAELASVPDDELLGGARDRCLHLARVGHVGGERQHAFGRRAAEVE